MTKTLRHFLIWFGSWFSLQLSIFFILGTVDELWIHPSGIEWTPFVWLIHLGLPALFMMIGIMGVSIITIIGYHEYRKNNE